MSTYLVPTYGCAGEAWKLTTYDTACVSIALEPGGSRGDHFTDFLASGLLQAGRAQPTPIRRTRAVTRADIGRLEVALRDANMSIAVHFAERLTARDARLLATAAERAGVDAWLFHEADLPEDTKRALVAHSPVELEADAGMTAWHRSLTAGSRRSPWPCAVALDLEAGVGPANGCDRHSDAVGCVLDWFGHAIATSTVHERQVRTRLYQLTTTGQDARWRIAARARDTTELADQAAAATGLSPTQRARLKLRDCPANAAILTSATSRIEVPVALRPILAAQRAIRLADGYRPSQALLRHCDARVDWYLRAQSD